MLALLACLLTALGAGAQQTEKPMLEFRTSAYDTNGESNSIQLLISSNTEGDYIDVDCGFGTEEHELQHAVFDTETQSWTGTIITLNVSAEGMVRVYGNPEHIDIVSASGCFIREIDCSQLANLSVLDLSHNELERLDLTPLTCLQALYLNDNPFNKQPLIVGTPKNELVILDIGQMDHLDQRFNLSDYPAMVAFDAWSCHDLRRIDPSGCPNLQKISIDSTPVSEIDVTKNPQLAILNVSDTGIRRLDVSQNPELQQLYCDHLSGTINPGVRLESLDVTHNPKLLYLFAGGNGFEQVDVSKNPYLLQLYLSNNNLRHIDVSANTMLQNLIIRRNLFDFATLPTPSQQWIQYDYIQKNMEVERCYKVGDVIDLSQRVLREGTTTTCAVYRLSDADPSVFEQMGPDFYTYEDGRITLRQATADSVYVAFANTLFPEFSVDGLPLRTSLFVVKTAEDYGADLRTLSFTPASVPAEVSFTVGMRDASAASPKTFRVDWGDGKLQDVVATAALTPETQTVSGTALGPVSIYVPEGEDLTAFAIAGQELTQMDVRQAHQLAELTIEGAGLTDIDLQWNRLLQRLCLTGCQLDSLNLRGANDAFQKNLLADIDLHDNHISKLQMIDNFSVHHLNLSGNRLTELSMRDTDQMETLDLSDNQLSTINLSYCEKLVSARLSGNVLESITMPADVTRLDELVVSDNCLRFSTLPFEASQFAGTTYVYAPQKPIAIAQRGRGADLTAYLYGEETEIGVVKADGTKLTPGTDFTLDGGKVRFAEHLIGESLCATVSHPAFPELTLNTTAIEMAGMPTHLLATFEPTSTETGTLIMVADQPATTLCVDWSGEGFDLQTYLVGTSPTTFEVTPKAGCKATVWSYDENDHLTVFSIRGVKMASMDARPMHNLIALTVHSAGLSDISLPEAPELFEMNLEGNQLKDIDLTQYPKLAYLVLNGNALQTFDASLYPNLELLSVSTNQLRSVTLKNEKLWSLDLAGNELEQVDLTQLPNLYQLGLSENSLSTLDVSANTDLHVLFLDHNRFTFATLPLPAQFQLYTYANQERLTVNLENGAIDLKEVATAPDGTPTEFRWFVDDPYYDENGELTGEELVRDEDYSVVDAVTTFCRKQSGVVGCMTNEAFPQLLLLTSAVNVVPPSGIATVEPMAPGVQEAYGLDGRRIAASARGVRIVRMSDGTTRKIVR